MSVQITVMSLDFESFAGPKTDQYDKEEITIGRLEDNDIILSTPEVSSHHARLIVDKHHPTGTKIYLEDLGSTNGTQLDNTAVKPNFKQEVRPGGRIRIGNYLVKAVIQKTSDRSDTVEASVLKDEPPVKYKHDPIPADKLPPIEIKDGLGEEILEDHMIDKDGGVFAQVGNSVPEESLNNAPLPDIDLNASLKIKGEVMQSAIKQELTDTDSEENDSEKKLIVTEVEVQKAESNSEKIEEPKESASVREKKMSRVDLGSVAVVADEEELGALFSGMVTDGEVVEINFEALALFNIYGSVKRNGIPVEEVKIDGGVIGSTETKSDGTFEFKNIPEGSKFQINASKDGFQIAAAGLTEGEIAGDLNLDFNALKLVTIKGIITNKGNPLSEVIIDAGTLGKTVTGPDGSYTFRDVPEGTPYTLKVEKAGFKIKTT